MSETAAKIFVDVIFAGTLQIIFTVVGVGIVSLRRDRGALLRRFALFNVFLFAWSILGDAAWNYLTAHELVVLDDAPVWSAVVPFGRYLLDHAAGGNDGWRISGGTTLSHLRWLWIITVIPVWILAVVTSWRFRRVLFIRAANA